MISFHQKQSSRIHIYCRHRLKSWMIITYYSNFSRIKLSILPTVYYVLFTFLCEYEKHHHHSYIYHNRLRYRCYLFRSGTWNIIKSTFDSITIFLFLLLWLSILPPLTTFHERYFVMIHIYLCHYRYYFIFFDRDLWFDRNLFIFVTLTVNPPPSVDYISFIFLHEMKITAIVTIWAIITANLV